MAPGRSIVRRAGGRLIVCRASRALEAASSDFSTYWPLLPEDEKPAIHARAVAALDGIADHSPGPLTAGRVEAYLANPTPALLALIEEIKARIEATPPAELLARIARMG